MWCRVIGLSMEWYFLALNHIKILILILCREEKIMKGKWWLIWWCTKEARIVFPRKQQEKVFAASLKQSTIFQIILDDDIGDSVKDELNVVCVGGAGEMCVNLLLIFSLVEILKFHSDVARGFFVCVWTWKAEKKWEIVLCLKPLDFTCILWEADSQWRSLYFVLKEIFLVKKENYGSFDEPLGVANWVKKLHRLNHSIHFFVFGQNQIIAWNWV